MADIKPTSNPEDVFSPTGYPWPQEPGPVRAVTTPSPVEPTPEDEPEDDPTE